MHSKTADDLTPEELTRIEQRWKSDVDRKLDRLVMFADIYEPTMRILTVREEERERLRHAIIEKSIIGLVWAVIVFVGASAWSYIRSHLGVNK